MWWNKEVGIFSRRLCYEGGAHKNEISSFKKDHERAASLLSLYEDTEVSGLQPEGGSHQNLPMSAGILILDFLASKTLRKNVCCI